MSEQKAVPAETIPLAVAGDWHGDQQWAITAIRSARREGVKTLVHVGDFGFDWPGRKRGRYEDRLNRCLVENGLTLIVSGGNHDNWTTLAALPVEQDGLATFRSNIRVLPRGGRTTLYGLTLGGLGGAYSVDQYHRIEGKEWWPNEEPSWSDGERLIAEGPLDILITHDAPAGVPLTGEFDLPTDISNRADQTRMLLRKVVDALKPANVFCGHWHQRVTATIVHEDGRTTRVDVLDKEGSKLGNAVLVRRSGLPLSVVPISVSGGDNKFSHTGVRCG